MAPSLSLPAFDMRDWNPQGQRNGGRRQHLVAVRDEQQQVRTHPSEAIRQAESRHANALRHADIGIRTEQAFDAVCDLQAVALNLTNRMAELGRQVRAHYDELQVHFWAE